MPKLDRDRGKDHADRVVRHDLGQDHGQQVDRQHHQLRRQVRQSRADPADQQPRRPGMVQRRPDREHGEDQRQKPPLDKGKRLFRVDAAGQQHDGDADDGQDEDRRDAQAR